MISPDLLVQDHDEFTLSPLNDSINYQQTLSSSVKLSPQHHLQQCDRCDGRVESSDKLLNIPYPHFQEICKEEEEQQQKSDSVTNNISNTPTENGRIFFLST